MRTTMPGNEAAKLAETKPDAAGSAKQIRFVTVIGLLCNLFLTGAKLAAGLLWASQALVADAVHSLSDLATDFAVLFGVKYWSAPPDANHPYGHGRIETLITSLIGIALAAVGIGIGWNAVFTIAEPHAQGPGWLAFVVALVSIVSKEFLYQWTCRVGRRVGSGAVIANAWHHRSDALSSIPVALAIALAVFFPKLTYVDHLGAIVVSAFIIHAAWVIVKPTLVELTDSNVGEDTQKEILRTAKSFAEIKSVHAIRTRKAGSGICADLHIMVDGGMSVSEGHAVSRSLKQRLLGGGSGIVDVVVHLEPFEAAGVHTDSGKPNFDI